MTLALAVRPGRVNAGAASGPGAQLEADKLERLQQQVQELEKEIHQIRDQQVVPKEASDSPKTIGQSVSSLTKDLGNVRNDLSQNLGVHIHGLMDATWEYNLNQPDTTGFTKGGLNPISTGGSTNQLRVFDVNANGFTLQQFNLHIDRTAPGGVGFVSDLNFGQTANILAASTRYSNLNPAATSNEIFDPTQLYLTYAAPLGSGVTLQMGRFVTLLGEEIIPVYNNLNFNESRSFIFGFGIPFTHTGLRATYAFNDKLSAVLGVNNGWDDVSANNDGQTVEAQLTLIPNSQISAVVNGIFGPQQVNRGSSTRGVIDPIVTWKTPIPGLQLIDEYMYADETGPVSVTPFLNSHPNPLSLFPAGPNGTATINHGVHWQGNAAYIVYDLNENLEFATRGEWFDDPNGARTGLAQSLGEFTQTVNYKLPGVQGLLARLEYRHDISGQKPFYSNDGWVTSGGVPTAPAHTYSGQETFELAVVYSY